MGHRSRIARYPYWASRLHDEILRHDIQRFQWGAHDCCIFACDCVLAMTGVDLADSIRGYGTLAEAKAIFRQYGGLENLAHGFAGRFGIRRINPTYAKRGDVVLIRGNVGHTLGVIGMNNKPTAAGFRGCCSVDRKRCELAWMIG